MKHGYMHILAMALAGLPAIVSDTPVRRRDYMLDEEPENDPLVPVMLPSSESLLSDMDAYRYRPNHYSPVVFGMDLAKQATERQDAAEAKRQRKQAKRLADN